MLPWQTIEKTKDRDGVELTLMRRGAEWVVRANGRTLMSSAAHGSEEQLARLGLERHAAAKTVLLGGLGLGFTARAALDRLGPDARLIVVELSHALVDWNRTHVADLAKRPLDDPRVRLQIADAAARIREAKGAFDAILLDLDNGPTALARAANQRLYGVRGIAACFEALKGGGVLAVWSAGPDAIYLERLQRAGFRAKAITVTAHATGGVRHTIFLAVKVPARRGAAGAGGAGAGAAETAEPAGRPARPRGPRADDRTGPRGPPRRAGASRAGAAGASPPKRRFPGPRR